MKIVNVSVVKVREVMFEAEGTYQDPKTKEAKVKKKRWNLEGVFVEVYRSKLDKKQRYREVAVEAQSDVEITTGDWLVELEVRKFEGKDEYTITIKRVLGKGDLSLFLQKTSATAKGEKL